MPRRLASAPTTGGGLLVVIFLVALNLRAGVAGVPPLADTIADDLSLTAPQVGLLTALPPLCMGLFAPLGQRLAHRVGRERAVALALVAAAAGSLLRGFGAVPAQYAGTLLLGVGIAFAGTALPGVVKQAFPRRPGLATGVYMLAMMVGAGAAAGLVVPLSRLLSSWPAALGSLGLLAILGLLAWLPVARRAAGDEAPDTRPAALPWRDRTAWAVTAYLTLQSTIYYTQLAWIPSSYIASGWTDAAAGALLVAYTGGQLVAGIAAPALADRVHDLRRILWPLVVLIVAGTAGLAAAPELAPWVWMVLLGLGLGGAFAMGLVLLVAYADSPAESARLSALAFLVSYSVAAVGPLAFGALLEMTGFGPAWAVVLVLAVGQLLSVHALRPGRVVTPSSWHPPAPAVP